MRTGMRTGTGKDVSDSEGCQHAVKESFTLNLFPSILYNFEGAISTHTHLVLFGTGSTESASVKHRAGGLSTHWPRTHATICAYEEWSAPFRKGVLTKVTLLQKTGGRCREEKMVTI